MMDKHIQKVLSYINSECEAGSYKVISDEDLISVFNKKYKPTEKEIAGFIEELKRKKLITVKYKDDTSYLVTSTQSGKNFSFSEPSEIKFKTKHIIFFVSLSLASGILSGLIFGLILKFFG